MAGSVLRSQRRLVGPLRPQDAYLLVLLNDVEARDRLVGPHTVSEAGSLKQPSFVFDGLCAFSYFDHLVDARSQKADSLRVAHEYKHPLEVTSEAYNVGSCR